MAFSLPPRTGPCRQATPTLISPCNLRRKANASSFPRLAASSNSQRCLVARFSCPKPISPRIPPSPQTTCCARSPASPCSDAPAAASQIPQPKACRSEGSAPAAPVVRFCSKTAFHLLTRSADGFTGTAFRVPEFRASKFSAAVLQACMAATLSAAWCSSFLKFPKLHQCRSTFLTAQRTLPIPHCGREPAFPGGISRPPPTYRTPTVTFFYQRVSAAR